MIFCLPTNLPFDIVLSIVEKEGQMKAIGIVGFKKSGKTTLALKVARALTAKNYRVAVIKHSGKPVPQKLSDTDKFFREVGKVAFITPESTKIMLSEQWDLNQIASLLSADFLIIEGFKSLKYFPKVYCLKDEKEKALLEDGLGLFTASTDPSLKEKGIADYVINEEKDLVEMVAQIEEKGFFLPEVNCAKCGYESCYGLAQAIVKGEESVQKCTYAQEYISIKINGKAVSLNLFMAKLYQSLISGMLAPLKNIDPIDEAVIEIKVDMASVSNKRNS